MSYIEVNTTWKVVGNGGGGKTATGSGTAFNTDTKQIEQWSTTRNLALGDPAPPDVHLAVGELLLVECDTNYTATKYIYDGGTAVRIETEANSAYCNYAPPLTCNLGTATVQQQATSAGATLTVQVSGTFNKDGAYSLDGGAEQRSPIFTQVSAGAHALLVRDTGLAGCERTVNITVVLPPPVPSGPPPLVVPPGPAQGVDFVQQPLWFTVASALAGGRVELELWAESSHGAEDFALVHTLRKVASATGDVAFRLDSLLLPLLRAFEPVPASAASRCTTSLVNYLVRTASYDAAGVATYRVSPLRTALRGGLPAEWQDRDYFQLRHSLALAPALSWQPAGPGFYATGQAKAVTYQQPEWLCWLCPVDVPDLRVARSYDQGPGTVAIVDYEPLPAAPGRGWLFQLLAIPLAPARPGFTRLLVQVETAAGVPLSQPAWYTFVEESPRTRYLLFTNSVAGLDTLRCEGRLEATLEATTEKVDRPAVVGASTPAADRQVTDLSANRKLKLTTGWLTAAELAWVQELVLSRELWLLVEGHLRPLDWSKRSLAAFSDEPGLRKLILEVDYAYAPTAYAPGIY